jgi:hypothetical protein
MTTPCRWQDRQVGSGIGSLMGPSCSVALLVANLTSSHRVPMNAYPGFLGFFYRNLGSSSIGNAFLTSYKTLLEKQGG